MTGKLISGGIEVCVLGSGNSHNYSLPDVVGNVFITFPQEAANLRTVRISGRKEGEGFSVSVPRTLEKIKDYKPGDPPLQLEGGIVIKAG